jgi:hypothetical protein
MAGRHHTLSGLRVCRERGLKSAGERNTHTGGAVRGPSVNRLHGGLWELARLAFGGDLAAGVIPCWKIDDCVLGELRSRRPSRP